MNKVNDLVLDQVTHFKIPFQVCCLSVSFKQIIQHIVLKLVSHLWDNELLTASNNVIWL